MKLARRFITSREGFLRQIFSICKSFRRHPAQLIARRLGCLFIRLSKRLSSIICLYRDKFNLGQQDVSKMFQFVQTELANPMSFRSRNLRICTCIPKVSFNSLKSQAQTQGTKIWNRMEEVMECQERYGQEIEREVEVDHHNIKCPISQGTSIAIL